MALLIGVSDYEGVEGASLPPLPTAKRDVEAIAKVLQQPDKGGFDEAQVQTLLDPDLQSIRFGIETLLRDRATEDLVLLYYSGHAISDENGSLYFATRNTDLANLSATAVAADFLQALMYTSVAQQQVIILDCYFSGGIGLVDIKQQLGGYGKAVLTGSTFFQSRDSLHPPIAHPNPEKNCFEYSAKQKSTGLSTYTHYFIEGMETGAADSNKDGIVTLFELHEYASSKVQMSAPALQPAIYALPEIGNIQIAKTPTETPQQLYRQAVENFVQRNNGMISLLNLRALDLRRDSLELHQTEAVDIQDEVLKPYREYKAKFQFYKEVVQAVKQLEDLPPSAETQKSLQHLHQDILGLTDVDVAPIEAPLYPDSSQRLYQILTLAAVLLTVGLIGGIYATFKYMISPAPFSETVEPSQPTSKPTPTPVTKPAPQPSPAPQPPPVPSPPPAVKFRLPRSEPITLTGHTEPVQGLAIDPRSRWLISGSWDNTIKIWDLETGTERQNITEHTNLVREIVLAPSGDRFASASQNGTVKIWRLDPEAENAIATLEMTLSGHSGPVYAIAFGPRGETLIGGGADNTIKIWSLETGAVLYNLTDHRGPVRALALGPDGETLVSGAGDNTIKVWNPNTGELQKTLTGHEDLVRALAIAPNGNTLVSASWDETIKIWNLNTGELQKTLTGHTDKLTTLAISPLGNILVSGSDDNTIKIWNLKTGKELQTLTDHVSDVFSVVISLDGKTLASASWDKTIKVWR
ncbi:caspase family protein [Phormidium sp. CCY1219]|uniref:caspase family protein n=1 Tax=Phormidium sp. CCY1219 TaxID=2886104 RepID=UPI002D797133|nr:caspase family protein [Phormidium sp. CCY1219]